MSNKTNRLKGNNQQEEIVDGKEGDKKSRFQSVIDFFKNEKTHKVTGLILMLLSVYLAVAFTSFLFTWKTDSDKIAGSTWTFLFNNDIVVENWLGKIGAIVANLFIHQWFGIASFLFVLLFLITGTRILFQISILSLRKTFKYSFFGLIWISTTLGYIVSITFSSLLFLGGGFGHIATLWLNGLLGVIGTGLLLGFSALVFLVVVFNISFVPKKNPRDEKVSDEAKQAVEEEPEEKKNSLIEPETNIIEFTPDNTADLVEEDKSIRNIQKKNQESEIPLTIEPPQEPQEISIVESSEEVEAKIPLSDYDPTLDLSSYQFPTLDLLENYGSNKIQVDRDELEANKNKIIDTLKHYDIGIDKIKATIGPTVTLYEIVPSPGVRISKIKNLEDDIALSLAALGIRIIAPMPGKGTIGIEVPNQKPEIVGMRSILASEKFQNTEFELPIALGKTISNEVFIADLTKMPHLLMAGSTGQGKSVGLNAILVSLLYKKHPSQVKFVLVDPKKVELTLFRTIERHFLAKLPGEEEAIISDTGKVKNTLNSLCQEMELRYDLLKDAQVRNIKEYNTKFIARKLNPNNGHRYLPYIVLVIDEFADLIMTAGKEIELPMARLAQLARAIGIHLVIATQRPSVNIITGTIKANFPARLAFRVISKIDSRTILDGGGADQLIGRGDMLLSTGADLIRLQCAFVDTPEVEKITEFIGSQRGYPDAHLLPEFIDENAEKAGHFEEGDKDPMFDEAARIVVQHQQGSASLLQRRLKLGYNRAGRIIDQLESAGIIGPFEGSKAREVLIKDALSLEQILTGAKQ